MSASTREDEHERNELNNLRIFDEGQVLLFFFFRKCEKIQTNNV